MTETAAGRLRPSSTPWVWSCCSGCAAGSRNARLARPASTDFTADRGPAGRDPKERTDLITHGVFGYVRNPIFTAMIAAQAGTTLLAPTWLAILGFALLVVGVEIQVRRVEEPHLLTVHGPGYADYSTGTRRFLPLIGRSPGRASTQVGGPSRP